VYEVKKPLGFVIPWIITLLAVIVMLLAKRQHSIYLIVPHRKQNKGGKYYGGY